MGVAQGNRDKGMHCGVPISAEVCEFPDGGSSKTADFRRWHLQQASEFWQSVRIGIAPQCESALHSFMLQLPVHSVHRPKWLAALASASESADTGVATGIIILL